MRAAGARGLSCAELTGRHALERTHPTLPLGPGRVERREVESLRPGPQTLSANFAVAQGPVVAPTMGPTRTEPDCVAHIAQTLAGDPEAARGHCVVDTLNSQHSERLVHVVAQVEGVGIDLGEKGNRGILKSRASRAAFRAEPSHKIGFQYTPTHAAGLKQSEVWFSRLTRKLLKRASFTAVDARKARLLAFVAYFNATLAKPFKWTSGHKPLAV